MLLRAQIYSLERLLIDRGMCVICLLTTALLAKELDTLLSALSLDTMFAGKHSIHAALRSISLKLKSAPQNITSRP